jgi:retinol dehydrogenase-12
MASRSASRSQKAIAELKEQTGKEAVFLPLDLGNLASVRNAAEEFMRYDFRDTRYILYVY